MLLQPVVASLDHVAGGVNDGRAGLLDASLGGVVCGVDAATDSLGAVSNLAAEPLEISQNGLRAGLCCTNFFSNYGLRSFFLSNLGELIIPLLSESLSESLSLFLSVESVGNLGVEVVAVVVSLLLSVASGGSGGESGVECEAHRVIDQISLLL